LFFVCWYYKLQLTKTYKKFGLQDSTVRTLLAGLALANVGICANCSLGIACIKPAGTLALLGRKFETA
jgi:hypothetical protein